MKLTKHAKQRAKERLSHLTLAQIKEDIYKHKMMRIPTSDPAGKYQIVGKYALYPISEDKSVLTINTYRPNNNNNRVSLLKQNITT